MIPQAVSAADSSRLPLVVQEQLVILEHWPLLQAVCPFFFAMTLLLLEDASALAEKERLESSVVEASLPT